MNGRYWRTGQGASVNFKVHGYGARYTSPWAGLKQSKIITAFWDKLQSPMLSYQVHMDFDGRKINIDLILQDTETRYEVLG